MDFSQKELIIKSQKVCYKQAGAGYPVLLLHGWGVDSKTMDPIAQHLAADFTVYNIDFPGFGLSPTPEEAWSVYDYADCIENFLSELRIVKPLVIGHSFGGRISILLGKKQLPKKIILVDSAGILPKRGLNYYAKVYSYKAAKKLMSLPGLRDHKDKALAHWRKNSGSADYQAADGILRQIFVKVVNEDLQPYLSEITAPTLLVWGDQDTATPLTDGQLMEKLIPGSGLVVLTGTGHYSFLEKLPQFLRVLDSFFAQDKSK